MEIAIATHLPLSGAQGEDPLSRNHINILSADMIVALPGGAGTLSEVRLAQRYRKPLIAWGWAPPACETANEFSDVRAFLETELSI